MELINNLFPQNSIDAAIKLLKVRRDLENSIPLYLNDYGFCKLGKSKDNLPFIRFIDYRRKIFLCYRKNDISSRTSKARELMQKLIESLYDMCLHNSNYQVIYGYLISTSNDNTQYSRSSGQSPSADIIVNNITINVLSGESLLRYVFQDSLQHIIEHMKTRVNELFESDHNNNSAISDTL